MTLCEYLENIIYGKGALLIATDSDEEYGLANLNMGKCWKSDSGMINLRRVKDLDAFSKCSEELVDALLDADVVEVDAYVDNKEQKEIFDEKHSTSDDAAYLCVIVSNDYRLAELANAYFEEHGFEEKHFFLDEDGTWPCDELTKEEYKQILDIWKERYTIQGADNKTAVYDISLYNRALFQYTIAYGFETLSQTEASLEKASELQKEIDIFNGEAKKKAKKTGGATFKMDDSVLNEIVKYATIKSLEVIDFDLDKYLDLCRITNSWADGVFGPECWLRNDEDEVDE